MVKVRQTTLSCVGALDVCRFTFASERERHYVSSLDLTHKKQTKNKKIQDLFIDLCSEKLGILFLVFDCQDSFRTGCLQTTGNPPLVPSVLQMQRNLVISGFSLDPGLFDWFFCVVVYFSDSQVFLSPVLLPLFGVQFVSTNLSLSGHTQPF